MAIEYDKIFAVIVAVIGLALLLIGIEEGNLERTFQALILLAISLASIFWPKKWVR